MKRVFIFSILIKAIMLPLACTSGGNSSIADTGQVISSGTWHVTLFVDNNIDETTNFTGYGFIFSSGGAIAATKNAVTTNGTWTVNNSSNKFNIDLGPKGNTNIPLGDLTNDWQIISSNVTEVRLKNDNSTSNEFLTFTKN